MKKRKLLRFVGVLSLFAILFSSCSKDSLTKPASQPGSNHNTTNLTNEPSTTTGMIKANLSSPSAWATSLIVYNDQYVSAETFADANGDVVVQDIPKGIYTVLAYSYSQDPSIDPTNDTAISQIITITDVKVFMDQTTTLGQIVFK